MHVTTIGMVLYAVDSYLGMVFLPIPFVEVLCQLHILCEVCVFISVGVHLDIVVSFLCIPYPIRRESLRPRARFHFTRPPHASCLRYQNPTPSVCLSTTFRHSALPGRRAPPPRLRRFIDGSSVRRDIQSNILSCLLVKALTLPQWVASQIRLYLSASFEISHLLNGGEAQNQCRAFPD